MTYEYAPEALEVLAGHGLQPTPATGPGVVREALSDLYRYEIRQLRGRLLRQEFPRSEYASRVEHLRQRYPVLVLLPREFVE